jgi:hypothetical protein
MRRTARLAAFAVFVTLGAVTVAPSRARAQSAVTLQAERSRLRAQLDKVNAEIDMLKRTAGGVRDDYRLRARLADAESLARRLMEIEARLGIRVDGIAKLQPPPTAAPTDGPSDLDAKADILVDQSRRVRAQADALVRRAADLKGRQELRRRTADLDRDPFAPMEGSKRRVASAAAAGTVPGTNVGGQNIAGAKPADASLTPAATTNTERAAAPLSVQLRDMLDTAALTDIRRLETSGAGPTSPQTLERAAAALKTRADWLEAQSRAMRAKAQATK